MKQEKNFQALCKFYPTLLYLLVVYNYPVILIFKHFLFRKIFELLLDSLVIIAGLFQNIISEDHNWMLITMFVSFIDFEPSELHNLQFEPKLRFPTLRVQTVLVFLFSPAIEEFFHVEFHKFWDTAH